MPVKGMESRMQFLMLQCAHQQHNLCKTERIDMAGVVRKALSNCEMYIYLQSQWKGGEYRYYGTSRNWDLVCLPQGETREYVPWK